MQSFKEIARIFEEIELRLIKSLKRNIAHHKNDEKAQGFDWSMWQAEKLRNINRFRRECSSIMNEYTEAIDFDTRQLMEEEFSQAVSNKEEPQFFGVDHTKLNHLIDDTVSLEKHSETAALRTMDDVYRQTIMKAQFSMSSGTVTINQAIDMAVKDFLEKGINCIVYRDGRKVNIADYVRMALRSASTRAALQGKSERFKTLGFDTVLVSRYSMCSDTCLPWQGRVYINDVYTMWDGEAQERSGGILYGKSTYCGKWFPLLSSAIHEGLFHPNCRHTILLWRDGDPMPEPIDNTESERRYRLEQHQRHLENNVRKAKRKLNGLSDPENIRKAKLKLKDAQSKLREFIETVNADEGETVLKRDYGKEKIYEKSVDNSAESGIIDLNDNSSIYMPVTQEAIDRVPKLNIFEDDEMNKRHQQAAKDLLTEVMKHSEDVTVGTEYSIRYNAEMLRPDGEDYRQGEVGSVKMQPLNEPFHAFHNHGSGGTLSFADIWRFANTKNMLSITAVGNNGNNYCLLRSDRGNPNEYIYFLANESKNVIYSANGTDFTLLKLSDKTEQEKIAPIISQLSHQQRTELKNAILIQTEKCLKKGDEIYGFKYKKYT